MFCKARIYQWMYVFNRWTRFGLRINNLISTFVNNPGVTMKFHRNTFHFHSSKEGLVKCMEMIAFLLLNLEYMSNCKQE
jgi:hypothetical protein